MRNRFLLFLISFAFCSSNIMGQYLGGISNGFGSLPIANINLSLADSLYNGGTGTGFYLVVNPNINLSIQDSLYNGGLDDGSNFIATNLNLSLQDSLYNGGLGRGDNQLSQVLIRLSLCNDKLLVWNGNQSVFWNNATNWDCGTVPISTSIVSIPANATRMPVIAAGATASRVIVLPNATINLIGAASLLTLTGQ
jgi:hypothetical protein